jgi:hypothetical protein
MHAFGTPSSTPRGFGRKLSSGIRGEIELWIVLATTFMVGGHGPSTEYRTVRMRLFLLLASQRPLVRATPLAYFLPKFRLLQQYSTC